MEKTPTKKGKFVSIVSISFFLIIIAVILSVFLVKMTDSHKVVESYNKNIVQTNTGITIKLNDLTVKADNTNVFEGY
jgi:hypothetical protein